MIYLGLTEGDDSSSAEKRCGGIHEPSKK